MKKILLGVVIGALITAFLFVKFLPRPGPDPEPVIITVKEPVYISDISGQATIPDQPAAQDGIVSPDFKVTVPVAGQFITENADVKVSGETTVERIGDLLTVDTVFHEAEINVNYKPPPESPDKLFEIGAYVYTDFNEVGLGWHFEKDWIVKETRFVDIISFYRYQSDVKRHYAGVGINF